jgi:hypothetical protein
MAGSAFRAAVEKRDPRAVAACLADDVVFRSPIVFKPYEGREAVGELLGAVFTVFEEFRYTDEVLDPETEVLVFEGLVGNRQVQGVDLIRLDDDGRITELIVLVRPMSGVHALADAMREHLASRSQSLGS